jgi:uncharacterized protein YecE (DUF72 family)
VQLRAGTSGYSYKEWRGPFYPERLKPAEMLAYYSRRLETVEINATFYRLPGEATFRTWSAQVPEGFSFVLKAPRRITHQLRLAGASEGVEHLVRAAAALGDKLGPVLFQLPPFQQKDLPRLAGFLGELPRGLAAAFEFRHASWFDTDVYAALRERDAALVIADTDERGATPVEPTADWGYLRLRRADYDDEALGGWAARVAAQPWRAAWVFFKHEDQGAAPRQATRFAERFRQLA